MPIDTARPFRFGLQLAQPLPGTTWPVALDSEPRRTARAAFDRFDEARRRGDLLVARENGWPDPRFNFAYYIREVETRVGPQQMGFGISQVVPWFGKLALRKRDVTCLFFRD